MTTLHIALLPDRGAVRLTGADARKLLQGLITNDMDKLAQAGDALHSGLLTPQGKILFAFFVVQTTDGFLLETERDQAAALAKRLTFYKLRAAVKIEDVSQQYAVAAVWSGSPSPLLREGREGGGEPREALVYPDPRHPSLGQRIIAPAECLPPSTATPAAYHAHRISLGVPDAGSDYPLGDTYPHEAGFDLFHGADFDKGCFVGQEVVARMQHKTVVRKRVVRVASTVDLPSDQCDVTMAGVTIGRLGSGAGQQGLALIRLDRAVEAIDKGEPITAGGATLALDTETIAAYRAAVAAKVTAP